MKNLTSKPPPDGFDLPIVHAVREFYLLLYQRGKKLPKRDRFGLWARTETQVIEILILLIKSGLSAKVRKLPYLEEARIKIETTKHLIRLAEEGGIIERETYLDFQIKLQEISKMASGWLKYTQKEP